MVGQSNGQGFHMATIPTFEETIANLPYDAMQLQRTAVPNPSGKSQAVKQKQCSFQNLQFDVLVTNKSLVHARLCQSETKTSLS